MRPSRTYLGPTRRLEIIKTQGIIRFIAIWALQGNPAARHHQKTQGIITFTAMWVRQLRKNSIKPPVFKHFCDLALQETLGVPKAPLGAP